MRQTASQSTKLKLPAAAVRRAYGDDGDGETLWILLKTVFLLETLPRFCCSMIMSHWRIFKLCNLNALSARHQFIRVVSSSSPPFACLHPPLLRPSYPHVDLSIARLLLLYSCETTGIGVGSRGRALNRGTR